MKYFSSSEYFQPFELFEAQHIRRFCGHAFSASRDRVCESIKRLRSEQLKVEKKIARMDAQLTVGSLPLFLNLDMRLSDRFSVGILTPNALSRGKSLLTKFNKRF